MGKGTSLAAAITGGINGYLRGMQINDQRARDEADRAWTQEQRAAQRAATQRENQTRISLASAAAPTAVEEGAGGAIRLESADNRDVDGTAITLAQGKPFRAAGSSFSDRAAAEKAAAEYNSEPVTLARVGKAYMAAGDPAKAITLKDAALGLEVKKSQLDEGMRKRANEQFDASLLAAASTADGLAKYMSGSPLIGGAAMKSVISPDGKTVQFMTVGSDGTEKPAGKALQNDPAAWTPLVQGFMKTLTPEKKIEHLFTRHKFETEEAGKAEDRGERKRHNTVTESNAAERIRLQGEATAARIEAAGAKAAGAAAGKAPPGYRFTPEGNLQAIPGGPADQKIQGAFNADVAAMSGASSGMDRLAAAANELKNHAGLKGITGLQGALPNMPGSDAANAAAMMNTLKSQVAFGVLQDMRNSSKTGGALGAVSEKELVLLQNNLAALEKAQSFDAFKKALGDIVKYTDGAKDRMRSSFNMRHSDKPSAETAQTAAPTAQQVSSPADIAKLPSGSLFVGPDGVTRRKP